MDELLVGALIFIGLIFLYPTIAMYYMCFVSLWMSVQVLQTLLTLLLILVNEFPFFLNYTYFVYPGMFTNTVSFEIQSELESVNSPTAVLVMHTKKLKLVTLYRSLLLKLKKLIFKLVNFETAKNVVLGNQIPHVTRWDF